MGVNFVAVNFVDLKHFKDAQACSLPLGVFGCFRGALGYFVIRMCPLEHMKRHVNK